MNSFIAWIVITRYTETQLLLLIFTSVYKARIWQDFNLKFRPCKVIKGCIDDRIKSAELQGPVQLDPILKKNLNILDEK